MKVRTGGGSRDRNQERKAAQNSDNFDGRRDSDQFSENLNRHRLRRYVTAGIFFLLVAVLVWYWFGYRMSKPYSKVSEVWSVDITTTASQKYCPFAGGIIQYGNKGAVFYNSSSGASWSASYDMKNPVVAVSGEYALIYDQGERTAVVLSVSGGVCGQLLTELPISKGTVSSHGVTALLVEKDLSNNMVFFDRQGNQLEITVKTLMSESGYPMDMSFSPDGQTMVVSFVYVDNGILQDRIVFYNFDTSRNTSTHVVASFQKYGDTLFPDVAFLSEDRAAAFGDGKVVIFSMVNALAPEEIVVIEPDSNITNLAYDDSHIVFATEDGNLFQSRNVFLYNTDGTKIFETKTDFELTQLCLGEKGVYLTGSSTLQYFNLKGKELFRGSVDNSILQLSALEKGTEFLVVTNQKFLKLKLIK